MSIVKMKKLSLFAVRAQKDELLHDLLLLGCVEVSEPEQPEGAPELTSLTERETSELERFKEEYGALTHTLDILQTYAPVKTKLFAPRPVIDESALFDETETAARLALCERVEGLELRLRHMASEETRLRGVIESLKPWVNLQVPLDKSGTASTVTLLGSIPASAKLPELESALSQSAPEAELFKVSTDREQQCLFAVVLRDEAEAALDTLRAYGFSQSSLRSLSGTAKQNIEETERKLAELAETRERVTAQIAEAGPQREKLRLTADLISTKIARAEAAERLLRTDSTLYMTGWVTAPQVSKLEETLKKYDCAWELTDPTPEDTPEVPIALKNNKLTSPLMMVTEMYSLPSYDGVDPNPLIMPWFTVFFGIMYADMGYGLVLLILGILASALIKPRGGLKNAVGLLKLCGVTTIVFGFLFGSFFGDMIPVLTDLLGITHKELWCLVNPLEQPMVMLVGSLAVGVVHIVVGMGINAVMLIRDGKWYDALFDVGSWWMVFAGIALGALGITWWLLIAGVAALVLTQGRAKPTIIGKLVGGIASIYDITSYLGDILSYTRLMALLMASSVIASVVNVLGSLSGSIIVFIIVFLIGHIFNMGINIIGTYVHAARLQYLEFFGKFYKDGGRPFAPLRIKTKYVDIIKEDN